MVFIRNPKFIQSRTVRTLLMRQSHKYFFLLKGLAYLGEYPLAWAACLCNETIYNILIDEGASPDDQVTEYIPVLSDPDHFAGSGSFCRIRI